MSEKISRDTQTVQYPTDVPAIPAMTSNDERRCYYRLTLEQAHHGTVVELGTWLGAATAWMAAGIRDSGCGKKMHTYDRFRWDGKSHVRKAKMHLTRNMVEEVRANLGPLSQYVEIHKGEIADLLWNGERVSLIVFDAPKRVKAISASMLKFAPYVYPGTIIVWQDFTHSASYDIPACMFHLMHHFEFLEAVPGSTAVFRVKTPWEQSEVTREALSVDRWPIEEIEARWSEYVPLFPDDMAAHFLAGQAMFLCDRGAVNAARNKLRNVLSEYGDLVVPKWRDMRRHRPNFVQRFAPLFAEIAPRL